VNWSRKSLALSPRYLIAIPPSYAGGGRCSDFWDPPGSFIPLQEIPHGWHPLRGDLEPGTIEAKHRIEIPRPSYSYATHIAVIEIDPETGELKIPRYIVAHDCGKIVNPLLVRRAKSWVEWFRESAKYCANMWSTIRAEICKHGL